MSVARAAAARLVRAIRWEAAPVAESGSIRLGSPRRRLFRSQLSSATAHGVRDHHWNCRHDDEEVESDRPIVDVDQVKPPIGVERRVVTRFDLPESGDAWFDAVPTAQLVVKLVHLVREGGTRSDQAHRPVENVEELRKLVDAQGAHDGADSGHPWIVGTP